MKKIFLTLSLLLLSGCTLPDVDTTACDTSGTYAESTQETWSTDTFSVTFNRPHCWAVNTSPTQLMVTDYDSENFVELSTFALSSVEGGVTPSTKALETGETLYIYTSASEDHEAQIILDSLEVSYPNPSESTFPIASSSCDAPDYDYAQSLNYTWRGVTFDLPFCWGAKEQKYIGGQTSLFLYKSEQEEDKNEYVNFFAPADVSLDAPPLTLGSEKVKNLTLSGIQVEEYLENNRYIFTFASPSGWFLETGDPEDTDVNLILNSFTFTQP